MKPLRRPVQFLLFFLLGALVLLLITLSQFISSPKQKAIFQSRAASGKTVTVTTDGGATAIQQAIDSAKDGDTVIIPAGTYSGGTALPLGLGGEIWVSEARGASETCFVRIEKKNITIKGQGAMIYGEGHDKPYMDPYQKRAGVCVINSTVTFDGLRIKEFQKRCMVVFNSAIVYKNGIVDGCDEGGISLLGNSSALILNNMIVGHNFGGVMLWQNSQAKIVNNIFYNAGIMFFYHPKTDDKAHAEIINNIFNGGEESVNQVDWWKENASKLKTNKLSYNLFFEKKDCNPIIHFCDDFPGKMFGDPLYIAPVTDPRGIAAWANFGFKEGSPAFGVGDPSIPGPKNLGVAGGPCADPNSTICTSFIQASIVEPVEPTPTVVPEIIVPTETLPEQTIIFPPIFPSIQTALPTPIILQKNVFPQTAVTLTIQNKYSNKIIKIKGLFLQNSYVPVNKNLVASESMQLPYAEFCQNASNVAGGIFYYSAEDNFQTVRFKNINLDCNKNTIIEIQ